MGEALVSYVLKFNFYFHGMNAHSTLYVIIKIHFRQPHQSKLTLAVEHQLFNILLSIEMFHFISRNLVQFPLKLAAMHTHTHTHKNVLCKFEDDLNEI